MYTYRYLSSCDAVRYFIGVRALLLSKIVVACAALMCLFLFTSRDVQAQDLRLSFPQQYTLTPKGVNLQTGWFAYEKTDVSVGSLKFIRSRQLGEFVGGFGGGLTSGTQGGWTHNFLAFARRDNSTNPPFMHVWTGGRKFEFKIGYDGSSEYYFPAEQSSSGATLTKSGNQLTLIDQGGNTFTFSGNDGIYFYLQKTVDANGASITITYAGLLPKLIRNNLGFAIVLDYSGSRISAVCGFNTAQTYVDTSTTCATPSLGKTTYAYDGSSRLISVTDSRNGVTGFSYGSNSWSSGDITCVTLVNSPACAVQNTYTGEGYTDAVATQTTAAGNIWHYSYTPPPNPADQPMVPCYPYWSNAYMVDAAGRGTSARYDRGYLVSLTGPDGITDYLYPNGCSTVGTNGFAPISVETRYPWPTYVRKSDGIREYYEYDTRGNVLSRSVLPKGTPEPFTWSDPNLADCCVPYQPQSMPAGTLTTSASYVYACEFDQTKRRLCDKPLTFTDANGNTTTMTYDPAHGGLLTQTSPAINGVTAQTRYSYVQRQAWIKSSGSGYEQTGEAIYLLDSKSICKNGNPNSTNSGCNTAGDEVVTKYDYGPNDGSVGNNLLLKSVTEDYGGLNLRTCYKYDAQGNKMSETKPRGAVSGCPQ